MKLTDSLKRKRLSVIFMQIVGIFYIITLHFINFMLTFYK